MASKLPSPSRKPPFNGFGTDSDPKGKRSIKPLWKPEASGKDDDKNGAALQGAQEKESVTGAYPKSSIDKAYDHMNSVSHQSADVAALDGGKSGQGGKQDL